MWSKGSCYVGFLYVLLWYGLRWCRASSVGRTLWALWLGYRLDTTWIPLGIPLGAGTKFIKLLNWNLLLSLSYHDLPTGFLPQSDYSFLFLRKHRDLLLPVSLIACLSIACLSVAAAQVCINNTVKREALIGWSGHSFRLLSEILVLCCSPNRCQLLFV